MKELTILALLACHIAAPRTAAGNGSFESFWTDAQKANWRDKSPAAAKRIQWWRDARFGMFIHWDPSSVAASEISWSLIFFDSEGYYPWQMWESDKMFRMIHSLRPEILINNRCGLPGDFSTPEQKLGSFDLKRDWESCMTFTGFWSWHGFQTQVIPFEECLTRLIRCAGGNGNLLMIISWKTPTNCSMEKASGSSIPPHSACNFYNCPLNTITKFSTGTNNLDCRNALWPAAALAIVRHAGIQEPYRDIGRGTLGANIAVAGVATSSSVFIRNQRLNAANHFNFAECRVFGLPLTELEIWHDNHFQTTLSAGPAADNHDFDHDGLANLLEYALGSNPTVPDAVLPTAATESAAGESFLTLTVPRTAIQPGLIYQVEVSGNLTDWFPDVTVLEDSPRILKARDPIPLRACGRRFIRLRVVSP
jgi:hypothetical protein